MEGVEHGVHKDLKGDMIDVDQKGKRCGMWQVIQRKAELQGLGNSQEGLLALV